MIAPSLDLGPFRLLQPAGEGASATVWRGVHRATRSPVAIKIITGIGPDDTVLRERFIREVRAVARLDHAAIVRVHDHGDLPAAVAAALGPETPPGAPFLVMEWHGGGTLSGGLGRMRFAGVRATLLTLLDALAHAHARGVIHRDIKPANVLLGATGPVLSDFGVVFAFDDTRADGVVSGTPNYMAPEQIRGDWRTFGPWTDLYAVGCLAWALVTGRAPYAGRGVQHALRGHLNGELPPLVPQCHLPEAFGGWLRRLLARPPGDRFACAADAAVALMALPDSAEAAAVMVAGVGERGAAAPEATVVAPPVFVALDETAWSRGAGPHGRPPMPTDWRRPDAPWVAHLPRCGRALAELRELRLRGRHSERDGLWQMLRAVGHGQGARAVVLEGPAGIGKSRLATWMARRAHELGQAEGLRATHAPVPGPLQGIAAMMTRHLRIDGLDVEAAGRHLQRVAGFDATLAAAVCAMSAPDRTAEVAGERITLSSEREVVITVVQALAVIARRRPLIVLLDDVQWGLDALRLVDHVLTRSPALPVLFVLTMRTDLGAGRPAELRLLDAVKTRKRVESMRLEPLDEASHGDSSGSRLPLEPETLGRLVEATGGNPLFAAELLRHWLHIDGLEATAAGYRFTGAVPRDMVELWRQRLDALLGDFDPDPLPAIELAAVMGIDVAWAEWFAAARALGLELPLRAMEHLFDAGLARSAAAGRFVFTHSLLREALQDRARRGGRLARWHGAAADALAARATETGGAVDPVRLATHRAAAGDHAAAFEAWRSTVTTGSVFGEAQKVGAMVIEAARAGRRAGIALDSAPWIELKQVWSVHRSYGPDDSGVRHARHAVARARAAGGLVEARALRYLVQALVARGQLDEVDAALDRAERLSADAGDPVARARVLALRSTAGYLDDADDAERLGLEALGVLTAHGIERDRTILLNGLGELARKRGALDRAEGYYRDAIDALRGREPLVKAVMQANLALIALERGELDRAEALAERAHARAERGDGRMLMLYADLVRLACVGARGDAAAWDRAWHRLAPVHEMQVVDYEVARLLDGAARRARSALPDRAAQARASAVQHYRALGRHVEADALDGGPAPAPPD